MEVELLRSEVRLALVGECELELGIIAKVIIVKVDLLGEVGITEACLNKIIVVIAGNFHLI